MEKYLREYFGKGKKNGKADRHGRQIIIPNE
jgi:hypothetical protein